MMYNGIKDLYFEVQHGYLLQQTMEAFNRSKMKKKDLLEQAGISRGTLTKLNKDENVSTETLVRICTALKCDISDIVEITDIEN